MCIYATLNYILLPKGQIQKCPAWMHKVQSGNYAFLLCCSGGGILQRLVPPHGQTSYLRHCRRHFHSRSPEYGRKGKKNNRVSLEHGQQVWSGNIHSSDARWWGRDWIVSSPLSLLTNLPHDHSSPSLLGLRVLSASCALEQGNSNNIKTFNLGVAFLL